MTKIHRTPSVDVDGVQHRGGVVQGGEGAHEGGEDTADHHALQAHRQEGVDEHREGDVRVGDGPVGLETEGGCELLSDGGIRGLGERVGDHAGDEEQEHREELQVSAEDGTAAGFLLVLAGEDALDDELVGAPVPEFGILAGAHEVGHRVTEVIDGLGAADVHHRVPAAQLAETEPQDDEGTDEEDRRLQDGGLQDGFHTADDGVDGGDDHQGEGRDPEVDAQEGVQFSARPPARTVTDTLVRT